MTRTLTRAEEKKRERIENSAEKEVEWFFGKMGGRVPDEGVGPPYARPAAEAIQRWLRAIPSFHSGALSLRYEPKAWPDSLMDECGAWTSLVVRLECALHPSEGLQTTEELEQAAVKRIEEALVRGRGEADLGTLCLRAMKHVRLAIRAYAKARGAAPCALPRSVRGTDCE